MTSPQPQPSPRERAAPKAIPRRVRPQRHRKTVWAMTVAKLDKLCADAVRERDGHQCTLCGRPEEPGRVHDWAHILSRRYYATRWDWMGSTTLCRTCHQRFTRRPDEWFALCQTNMGVVAFNKLYVRATCQAGKQPLDLWLIAVQAGPGGVKPW